MESLVRQAKRMRATMEDSQLVGYGDLAPSGERAKERLGYPLTQIAINGYYEGRAFLKGERWLFPRKPLQGGRGEGRA